MSVAAAFFVVLMLFGHWVADFVLQPDWMAKDKAKDLVVLGLHSACIYVVASLAALITVLLTREGTPWGIGVWALINAAVHFGIDYVTSRINAKLRAADRNHDFFVMVGFDQFLHLAIAVVTFAWLVL